MDWNITWILTGSIAFLLATINLIRSIIVKPKGSQMLMFGSLSCGAITVLEEYRMINTWIKHGEMITLNSTVPTLTSILTWAIVVLIIINLISLVSVFKKS